MLASIGFPLGSLRARPSFPWRLGSARLFGGLQAQHSLDALPMPALEGSPEEEPEPASSSRQDLKVEVPEEWIPPDRCAFVSVFYGSSAEFLLLALVMARQMQALGTRHPLFVLPTFDVPTAFLEVLQTAGCRILKKCDYMWMHAWLLQDPGGRHSPVLTKLRCLGITGIHKVVLLDLDILPLRRLDALFAFRAPAAKLMPAYLPQGAMLRSGEEVPPEWLEASRWGTAGRINAGVCLLEPSMELLAIIAGQVDPERYLHSLQEEGQEATVQGVFGAPWRQTWTPEEDAITRAIAVHRPTQRWTHLGAEWNFEIQGNGDYYPEVPMAREQTDRGCFDSAAVLHFSGSSKPSWPAWFVGRREMSVTEACDWQMEQWGLSDPRCIFIEATRQWLEAFEDLLQHARGHWSVDIMELTGWAAPAPARALWLEEEGPRPDLDESTVRLGSTGAFASGGDRRQATMVDDVPSKRIRTSDSGTRSWPRAPPTPS